MASVHRCIGASALSAAAEAAIAEDVYRMFPRLHERRQVPAGVLSGGERYCKILAGDAVPPAGTAAEAREAVLRQARLMRSEP